MPAFGYDGPEVASLPYFALCRSKACAAVPCNSRLPRTPLRIQSRTGVPSSAGYVVCLQESCVPAFTSLCGAVPLPQFPPSTPPPPWHTPIKVRVLIVSPAGISHSIHSAGDRWRGNQLSGGLKIAIHPALWQFLHHTGGILQFWDPPKTAEPGWNALGDFHEKQSLAGTRKLGFHTGAARQEESEGSERESAGCLRGVIEHSSTTPRKRTVEIISIIDILGIPCVNAISTFNKMGRTSARFFPG